MYFFSNSVNASFDDTVLATKNALKRHGFEILTEIDMRKAFKRHLALDFRPYLILSAYYPTSAHHAVQIYDQIGSVLLCNVVVQQQNGGRVDISVSDPATSMYVINHIELNWIVRELRGSSPESHRRDRTSTRNATPFTEARGRSAAGFSKLATRGKVIVQEKCGYCHRTRWREPA